MTYRDLPGLMTRMTGDEKHSASATSTLDLLWVLYDSVMKIDPAAPLDERRDRFLLSKGHGPMAYYAVLAAKRFIPVEMLDTFGAYDSPLGQHPDRLLVPGVEISSGSLGHGLPIAAGVALALRAKGMQGPRVFCLVGDAELEEGSNAEAICLAGRLGLGELTVIVVDNHSSSMGWPGGIARRFELEGWHGSEIDGRDHEQIGAALSARHEAPDVVVAAVE
ncbi:MAG TPA: thiamine pyrophosphate-dependent enzyme, partial [Myxococcota bacterium]|nr:thiamine pyrophosphate-dependent enzyme [Myxococcota bacterium]